MGGGSADLSERAGFGRRAGAAVQGFGGRAARDARESGLGRARSHGQDADAVFATLPDHGRASLVVQHARGGPRQADVELEHGRATAGGVASHAADPCHPGGRAEAEPARPCGVAAAASLRSRCGLERACAAPVAVTACINTNLSPGNVPAARLRCACGHNTRPRWAGAQRPAYGAIIRKTRRTHRPSPARRPRLDCG